MTDRIKRLYQLRGTYCDWCVKLKGDLCPDCEALLASDEDRSISLAVKDDCDVTFREETARDVFLRLLDEGFDQYTDADSFMSLADKAVELTDALIYRLERKV